MHVIPWPGDSPHMNPIEYISDDIEREIEDVVFENTTGLSERIKLEWNSITMDYVNKWIICRDV